MIGLALCMVAAVPDGDTIRCADGVRLRLATIDAPEMHCRRTDPRPCGPGSGALESRAALVRLAGSQVRYRVVDANRCIAGFQAHDRYGRAIALAWNGAGRELAAAQLAGGHARTWTCRRRR